MRPPHGAGAPNVVHPDTRRRLAGTHELELELAGILVRLTASERRAFWLGVMLADGTATHRSALAAWVRHEDPTLEAVLVAIPPAPDTRPVVELGTPRRRPRARKAS